MTRRWTVGLLASAAFLFVPALDEAQQAQPAAGQPSAATNLPSGTPEGVARMQNHNSQGFPAPNAVEGQPIETRAPELEGDHPVFAGQTRAPFS